jgi:hypothetical protein
MTRADFLKAVDDGYLESVRNIFEMCAKNELGEGIDKAEDQFWFGVNELIKFRDRVITGSEKMFPSSGA